MTNLDYWQALVGEQSPEEFMRSFGSSDPELCIARFLEDRGNLYGVVNQGTWVDTFQAPDQHHVLTARVYLLSYLDETRDEWGPALEAKPPSIPRRYREKFDQDKYPPPPSVGPDGDAEAPPSDVEAAGSATDSDTPPAEVAPAPETSVEDAGQASEGPAGDSPPETEASTTPDAAGETDERTEPPTP